MRTIHLHGILGSTYNSSYRLSVNTPSEAIRMLCQLVPGFSEDFVKYDYMVSVGNIGEDSSIDYEELNLYGADDIHFVPLVEGAKKEGVGKILTAVAIFAVAWYAGPAAAALAKGTTAAKAAAFAIKTAKTVALIMAMRGVSQLLAPKIEDNNQEQVQSYLVSGPQNTEGQGVCVPLVYGRVLAGSRVISSGVTVEDVNPSLNQGGTGYDPAGNVVNTSGGSDNLWEYSVLV